MKKVMDPFMFGLRAKLMGMIPMIMGGFGFLSTKALFVANVALVLALISIFQLFFSGRTSSVGTKLNYLFIVLQFERKFQGLIRFKLLVFSQI